MAGRGTARYGKVRQGVAGFGQARRGSAGHGKGTKSIHRQQRKEIKEKPMAYSENQLYKTLTDQLMKAFGSKPRGTLITYAEIASVIGFDRMTKEGAAVLDKFKRKLRKRHTIRCVDNVGVLILNDEEAASRVPIERSMKARRQANKGLQELGTVDDRRLSDHLRRVCFQSKERFRFLRLMAGRAKREHEKETHVTDTMPMRPRVKSQ